MANSVDPDQRSMLIWVDTDCSALTVSILPVHMFDYFLYICAHGIPTNKHSYTYFVLSQGILNYCLLNNKLHAI